MIAHDGKTWLAAIIEIVMRRVDYHACYVARVVAQTADGALEVIPDNTAIPPMTGVSIRYGIPGVSAKVKAGARVLVGFEGGDPSRPIATVWESAAVTELRITSETKVVVDCPSVELGAEGGAPLARLGDVVESVLPPITLLTGTMFMPAPVAFTGTFIVTDSLVGVITSGAARAKAT